MLKSTLIKLHAAAAIFASRDGCSAQEIADILNVPLNSVYHYAKQHEWEETLDTLGYTGEQRFTRKATRDIQRDTGELVAQARGLYTKARRDGSNHKKAVTAVVNELGLKRRRVNEWAAKYEWEKTL